MSQQSEVANKIEVGRRVRIHLAYHQEQEGVIVAVHGEPGKSPDNVIGPMTVCNPNACRFDLVTFEGLQFDSRESAIGKPGIGRVDLLDRVHGPQLIEVAKRGVIERRTREACKAADDKQRFADAVERVKADNPHLSAVAAGKYGGAAHAARNMRVEFKLAGIKPKSVRSSSYSGGDSIDVYLPHDASDDAMKAAEAIAKKYQAGNFNGMEDIYEYKRSPWTEVFGDAKYVFVQREYKPEGGAT